MKKFIAIFFCVIICVAVMSVAVSAKTGDNGNFEFGDTLAAYGDFKEIYYSFNVKYHGELTFTLSFKSSQITPENGSYRIVIYKSGSSPYDVGHIFHFNASESTSTSTKVLKVNLSPGSYGIRLSEYGYGTLNPAHRLQIFTSFECSHVSTNTKTTKKATCSETGLEEEYCEECKETISKNRIDKLDHTPDNNWTVITEASCSQEGKSVKYCTVCSQEADERTYDKLPHELGEWEQTSAPTCSKAGQEKSVCSVCNSTETRETEKLDHTFGNWEQVTQSTCAKEGVEKRTCSTCKSSEERDTDLLDHDFGRWETTKKSTCKNEGEKTRTCDVCGFTETQSIKKTSHEYGKWTTTRSATCTSEGSRYRVCEVCNERETDDISKTDHDYGSWTVTSQPTESSSGSRRRTCRNCSKTETDTLSRLIHGAKTYTKVSQKATCTKDGLEITICENCNKTISEEKIPATGHSVKNWSVTTPATYDKDGVKSGTCVNCSTTVKEEYKFERPGRDGFKSGRKYDNRFNDVKKENWFFDYVTKAYEYSLANGMSNVEFSPNSTFTVAQALTVATNIHSAYYGDKPDAVKDGEKWYMPNVRYCIEHKIITEKQFDNYDRNITRGEMAQVFANILPEEEYKAVRNGRPNDMTTDIPSFNAVKKLYDAGIVSGDAETSNFRPNDNIKRSEACVIFTCIALPEYRKGTSK